VRWADARFDGLAFEHVELAKGETRAELHDQYAISVTCSGNGIIRLLGAEYKAHSGSVYLFCPNEVWIRRAASSVWCYETLYADRRKLLALMDQLGEQLYLAQCVARPPA